MQMDERSSGRRRRSEEVGRQYIDNNPARRRRRSTVASGKICKLHLLLLLLLRVDHYSNLVALAFRKRYKPVDNPPQTLYPAGAKLYRFVVRQSIASWPKQSMQNCTQCPLHIRINGVRKTIA